MHSYRGFHRISGPMVALTAATAALLLPTSPALAASAAIPAGEVEAIAPALLFTASDGQANRLTVRVDQGEVEDEHYYYVYTLDDVYPIVAGDNCEHPDPADSTKVVCTLEVYDSRDPYVTGRFLLRDGNDTLTFHNDSQQAYYTNEFWLGPGNDKALTRQPGGGVDGSGVWGQDGNDNLTTGSVGDSGGAYGGNGRDIIHAHDGSTWVRGGNGDDKLYGDDAHQSINGDDGNDLIDAGGSGDTLYGGKGDDTIHGRAGADQIFGNSGNDRLYGGPGNDTISGGPGKNVIKHD